MMSSSFNTAGIAVAAWASASACKSTQHCRHRNGATRPSTLISSTCTTSWRRTARSAPASNLSSTASVDWRPLSSSARRDISRCRFRATLSRHWRAVVDVRPLQCQLPLAGEYLSLCPGLIFGKTYLRLLIYNPFVHDIFLMNLHSSF